jgi:hypothetical protein
MLSQATEVRKRRKGGEEGGGGKRERERERGTKRAIEGGEGASLVAFYMFTYHISNYHMILVTD